MPNTKYTITLLGTGEVLADNLSEDEVADWWADNDTEYYGLRIEGTAIVVGRVELTKKE